MTLCFIDCETTGVHPDREVWEIAMVREDDRYCHIFVEVDLSKADPFGLNVGRFYERHPLGRYITGEIGRPEPQSGLEPQLVSPESAAKTVAVWTHGCHLVGAVPSFDANTLDPLLRKHSLIPSWHHRLYCVESLTAGHLGKPVGGLRKCAEALGMEFDANAEHTALGDALIAKEIWETIVGGSDG